MNSFALKQLARNMVLALIIGLGVMTLWGFGCAIAGSFIDQWNLPNVNEFVHVTRDGQVLVQEWHRDASYTNYRTLEGQPVTDQKALEWTGSCQSPIGKKYPMRLPWDVRYIGFSDQQVPVNQWYLITDGQPEGHAYFVGFNTGTKQQIGFVGLSGFQTEVPPLEQQFAFPSEMLNHTGAVAGRYLTSPLGVSFSASEASWIAHVLSDSKLYRVNLSRCTVEQVPFPEPIVSIAIAQQPSNDFKPDSDNDYEKRVAVRTKDKLVFLDYEGKMQNTISIPENMRGVDFDIYRWWTPTVLFIHHNGDTFGARIAWVDAQNQTSKQIDVPLRGEIPMRPTLFSWTLAFAIPAAIPFAVGICLIVPLANLFGGRHSDFAEAFAYWTSAGWPALLAVCLLGIGLAVACYRRQRRLGLEGAALWAVFVALFGVPGWIGYLLQRRWPMVERCTHCGTVAPRDREACFSCNADFPLPASKGIEIFA